MKTTATIDTRFFRAGVGTVIYNNEGKVAFFERAQHPVGIWQFQQGGIDLGEDTKTTLWRELKEEIGLCKDDIECVNEYPKWTVYEYDMSRDDSTKSRLGQAHRWFFLKLKSNVDIDLSKATEDEASSFRWLDFSEVIESSGDFKKHVYIELSEYFDEHLIGE